MAKKENAKKLLQLYKFKKLGGGLYSIKLKPEYYDKFDYIEVPNVVGVIESDAFRRCLVHEIEVPMSVEKICVGAFTEMAYLKRVIINNPDIILEEGFISCCGQATRLEFPNGLNNYVIIDDFLCEKNGKKTIKYLKPDEGNELTIEVPKSIEEVGKYTFDHINDIKKIIFSENIKTISSWCINSCNNIEEIVLLGDRILLNKHWEGINFDNTNKSSCEITLKILSGTKFDCLREYINYEIIHVNDIFEFINISTQTFKKIYVDDVLIVDGERFDNNYFAIRDSNLSTFSIKHKDELPNKEDYYFYNDFILSKDRSILIKYNGHSREKNVVIPDSITTILEKAFYDNKEIISITMNDNVLFIGESTFEGCDHLKTIKLSNNIEVLESRVFYGCSLLINLKLPLKLKSIKSYALWCCRSLSDIDFGDELEYIEDYALGSCVSLKNIKFPKSLQYIYSSTLEFSGIYMISLSNDLIIKQSDGGVFNEYISFQSPKDKIIYTFERFCNIVFPSSVMKVCINNLEIYKDEDDEQFYGELSKEGYKLIENKDDAPLDILTFIKNYDLSKEIKINKIKAETIKNFVNYSFDEIEIEDKNIRGICVIHYSIKYRIKYRIKLKNVTDGLIFECECMHKDEKHMCEHTYAFIKYIKNNINLLYKNKNNLLENNANNVDEKIKDIIIKVLLYNIHKVDSDLLIKSDELYKKNPFKSIDYSDSKIIAKFVESENVIHKIIIKNERFYCSCGACGEYRNNSSFCEHIIALILKVKADYKDKIKVFKQRFYYKDIRKLIDKFESMPIETYKHKPILLNDTYPFDYDYEVVEEINAARYGNQDKIKYLIDYYSNKNEERKKNYWINKLNGQFNFIENVRKSAYLDIEIVNKIKAYKLNLIEPKLLNRGLEVYKNKQLSNIKIVAKSISANCKGSRGENYAVTINYINEKLYFKCNCIASLKAVPFCKHVIALIKTIQDDKSYNSN